MLNRILATAALGLVASGAFATSLTADPASAAQAADARNAEILAACAATPPAQSAAGVCPLKATFGTFRVTATNNVVDFKPTRVVPLVTGQSYGWILRVNKPSGEVKVLERFTLPGAPRTWGANGQHAGRSGDDSSMSLDLTLKVYSGLIYKGWDVADGDPVGHHTIQVWVENAAPLQFDFDVVAPAKAAR